MKGGLIRKDHIEQGISALALNWALGLGYSSLGYGRFEHGSALGLDLGSGLHPHSMPVSIGMAIHSK
jgi:hypothetical protein